jgi:predicted MFS family arabinose efflux permease
MGELRSREAVLVLGALWLLVFSVTTQFMILAPVLPRIAEQLGVPASRLGGLVTGYSVAVAGVAVLAGPVSDRVGRRRMLLAGAGAMAVGLALHAVPGGYAALLAVRVLTGAGGGLLTGASAAYVGDYFPPERRGWANGWIMSGMAVGQIVGIPLGTLLAARWGFRLPFLVFAASMGLAFLLVWRFVPQPGVRRAGVLGLREGLAHYAALLRRRRAGVAVLSLFVVFLGTALYTLFLPTWLEEARGATPREVALLFAVGGVATALAGPPAGRFSDRVGRKRLVVGASLGVAAGMLATPWLLRELWVAYPLFFLLMAGVGARAGPFQALLAELVPDEQRGALMSLSMALGQAGYGAGSALAGAAYGAWGYGSNAALAAASALGVALLVGRFLPETRAEGGPAR